MRLRGAARLSLRLIGCLIAAVSAMVQLPATMVGGDAVSSGHVAVIPFDAQTATVVPSARQKAWLRQELTAFVHFVRGADPDRVMTALRDNGFRKVLLSATDPDALVESARKAGLAIGFDHVDSNTLHQVLTRHGAVDEVWPDPAEDQVAIIRALQPNAVIGGVDVRRVDNNDGLGVVQSPAECTASIGPNSLVETYFATVGRNCQLLLDVPLNVDVARLAEFGSAIASLFANDLTHSVTHEADGSVVADLGGRKTVGTVQVQESLDVGQRITGFDVQAWNGCSWKTVASGTSVGYKRLLRLSTPVSTSKLRLHVTSSRATPTISDLNVYAAA